MGRFGLLGMFSGDGGVFVVISCVVNVVIIVLLLVYSWGLGICNVWFVLL